MAPLKREALPSFATSFFLGVVLVSGRQSRPIVESPPPSLYPCQQRATALQLPQRPSGGRGGTWGSTQVSEGPLSIARSACSSAKADISRIIRAPAASKGFFTKRLRPSDPSIDYQPLLVLPPTGSEWSTLLGKVCLGILAGEVAPYISTGNDELCLGVLALAARVFGVALLQEGPNTLRVVLCLL